MPYRASAKLDLQAANGTSHVFLSSHCTSSHPSPRSPSADSSLLEDTTLAEEREEAQYNTDWESDQEEHWADPLAQHDERAGTGIQLFELYHQKGREEALREAKEWQLQYLNEHKDTLPEVVYEKYAWFLERQLSGDLPLTASDRAVREEIEGLLTEQSHAADAEYAFDDDMWGSDDAEGDVWGSNKKGWIGGNDSAVDDDLAALLADSGIDSLSDDEDGRKR